ncbi:mitochondrial fission ELM1 family protein [Lichenicola sp.]|uniref:mitochondrial fission ELM1 family protein n=1 Tax=Lichenicola sp. TaxID=2804529 RepID=UPI003B00464B
MQGVILTEGYAGLEAQALGLAERAGLVVAGTRALRPTLPWGRLPPRFWPAPLAMVGGADGDGLRDLPDGLLLTAGGTGAAVGAVLRRQGRRVVQIQNPRMRLDRFDLVVANRHDEIDGPNVLLGRTALHRVTPAVLAEARAAWTERLAHLPRPLVAVLVGGSNGRFRMGPPEAEALAAGLAGMMRTDRVGLALTPSRRTGAEQRAILERALQPLGGWVWDLAGANPYLGLLACADAIVVTSDSVSMVSEAAATSVPVLVAHLPGRSRRIGLFLRDLVDAGRIRSFNGRFESWNAAPLDDTDAVAAEMCRRLGLPVTCEAGRPAPSH